jgi:hypothetical protein
MSPATNGMAMSSSTPSADLVRRTLERYDEPLLRQVAGKLCKPRNQWPVDELIERCVQTVGNPTVIDRRLADLGPACVQLLALVGRSRQPWWRVGHLVEMAVALGRGDGLGPVVALLEAGLLYPEFAVANRGQAQRKPSEKTESQPAPDADTPASSRDSRSRLAGAHFKDFHLWLAQSSGTYPIVFAPPEITARAHALAPPLPSCPGATTLPQAVAQEADGLDWPLRLAVLWQQVFAAPLRRTQQGGFFKRDLDRLRGDAALNAPPPDQLAEVPDPALLAVLLAGAGGLLTDADGEFRAAAFPSWWESMPAALVALWQALLQADTWDIQDGWRPEAPGGHPYPSAWLLTLVLLAALPADGWAKPAALERWVRDHHPFWRGGKASPALATFLLGLAYPLRLVRVARAADGEALVSLSALGRWLLDDGHPPALPQFPRTLLVQPNLEILAYRQGLTPPLVARLTRLANWKTLGAACTLQLEPDSVYRALESGESFETIQQTLEQHGMKALPDAVLGALRTWSNKRDRIRVYTGGALFEFNSAEDLDAALARGLQATRLSDRLAVVADDDSIDFRHFRLTATRDYALPPERCVEVEADGVTLAVDLGRSDLLIETEIGRFAEPLERTGNHARRHYRLTPESLAAGRDSGLSLQQLETWFVQRSGLPLPPAVKLLFSGSQVSPYELRRLTVLLVPTAEIADGLLQWPGTRALIASRLGPTALAVAEEHVELLRERLAALGVVFAP